VKPEIAAAFKLNCLAQGVSMAGEITRFMIERNGGVSKNKPSTDMLGTRQKRRKAVNRILEQLEKIIDAETQYLENIPLNLHNSRNYETAEQTVSALEEVIDLLSEAY